MSRLFFIIVLLVSLATSGCCSACFGGRAGFMGIPIGPISRPQMLVYHRGPPIYQPTYQTYVPADLRPGYYRPTCCDYSPTWGRNIPTGQCPAEITARTCPW